MLNTGKNFALGATRKINILTLVLCEKKILSEKKKNIVPPPPPPPPTPRKLNGRSLTRYKLMNYTQKTSS